MEFKEKIEGKKQNSMLKDIYDYIIIKEEKKKIENMNSKEISKWLVTELRTSQQRYILSQKYEDMIEILKSIYESLSYRGKKKFREGLKIAILNIPEEKFSKKILKYLLFLVLEVKAVETIPAIVESITCDTIKEEKDKELFPIGLYIISEMSSGYRVADYLRDLVNSSKFEFSLAPLAFLGLCRAEPEKFPEHLELLRYHFYKLHENKKELEKAYCTAKRFVQSVGVKNIAENLSKIYIKLSPQPNEATDNWLVDSLFLGYNAPLLLQKEHEEFYIRKKDDNKYFAITFYEDKREIKKYLQKISELHKSKNF